MASLTAANSVLSLSISSLFPAAQYLQGFAVDDAFSGDSVKQAETQMGVDGYLSGGKVFSEYKMSIHLMATSPSIAMFDTWRSQMDAQVDVFIASGQINLPSIGKAYTLQKGFLTSAPPFPGVKKILESVVYEITWERIFAAPTM
jgi:hypothetical protein